MLPNRILYQIKFCSHKKDNYGIHFSYYGYDLLSLSTYHKTDYFPDLNLTLNFLLHARILFAMILYQGHKVFLLSFSMGINHYLTLLQSKTLLEYIAQHNSLSSVSIELALPFGLNSLFLIMVLICFL